VLSKKIILLVAFVIVLFGGLFGSKFLQINNAMSSRKPPPPPTITTTQVTQEQWQSALSTVGTVNPVLGVVISNEVAGTVSALNSESGDTVNKGDLILELDTSTDQAKLNGLLANKKLAQIKFSRLSTLLKRKATSTSSFDEARAELDVAKASVIEQQSLINKKKIRAPFSGKLGIRQVSLGQYIDKGSQIIPLVSLNKTIADFAFPERDFAQLKTGQLVKLKAQAYPNITFDGVIQAINPGLHDDTRTIAVRAVIQNPDAKLRAGMFADISVITSPPKPVLTLPKTAVLFSTYGENVYIVNQKDNKNSVELRNIETGASRNGRVEVLKGLSLNDTVVDEGHVKLRNGQTVTITNRNEK
jgi:membrane fusion protein (multidrug efflux system)